MNGVCTKRGSGMGGGGVSYFLEPSFIKNFNLEQWQKL